MIKTVWGRLREMSAASYTILRGGLLVACALLICSLGIVLAVGPICFDTYYFHETARVMREMAPGILFVSVIGSAFGEARTKTG